MQNNSSTNRDAAISDFRGKSNLQKEPDAESSGLNCKALSL